MNARTWFWRAMLVVALGTVLPLLSGCATDKQVISQAADVHSGLTPAVMNDPELSQYIQNVGDRIIAAARQMFDEGYRPSGGSKEDSSWMFSQSMKFHFVASDTLNAFTTGGEHMYVYTKLFTQCKSEDELAAVMAHEFAHVFARHVQRGMNRQYAMLGAAGLAGAAGYAMSDSDNRLAKAGTYAGVAALAGQFVGMGYTRGDEREADKIGFQFYTRAGWDPRHFADFFKSMIAQGYDKTPELVSDHPSLQSRVDDAGTYVSELPPRAASWRKPPIAGPARFRELQTRAARVAASMPQSDSLEGAKLLLASFPSCVTAEDQPEQKKAQQRLSAILANSPSK